MFLFIGSSDVSPQIIQSGLRVNSKMFTIQILHTIKATCKQYGLNLCNPQLTVILVHTPQVILLIQNFNSEVLQHFKSQKLHTFKQNGQQTQCNRLPTFQVRTFYVL